MVTHYCDLPWTCEGDSTVVVTRRSNSATEATPTYNIQSLPDQSIWLTDRTLNLTDEAKRQPSPIAIAPSVTTSLPRDTGTTISADKQPPQHHVDQIQSTAADIRAPKYKEYLDRKQRLSCEQLRTNKATSRSNGFSSCRQRTLTVRPGDSLYNLFKENGIDTKSLIQMASVQHGEHLQRLKPGQTLNLHVDGKGVVHRLAIPLSIEEQLLFNRRDTTYTSELSETPLKRRRVSASGIIESSLFAAGQQAGLPDKLVMELINIFAWGHRL